MLREKKRESFREHRMFCDSLWRPVRERFVEFEERRLSDRFRKRAKARNLTRMEKKMKKKEDDREWWRRRKKEEEEGELIVFTRKNGIYRSSVPFIDDAPFTSPSIFARGSLLGEVGSNILERTWKKNRCLRKENLHGVSSGSVTQPRKRKL